MITTTQVALATGPLCRHQSQCEQLRRQKSAEIELRITQHITNANPQHIGYNFVRTLLDSFDLRGPCGTHVCMVFDPLREPLWLLKRRFQGDVLPSDVLRLIVRMVLEGLDYLH